MGNNYSGMGDGHENLNLTAGTLAHAFVHRFPGTTLTLIAGCVLGGFIAAGQHRISTVTSTFNGCLNKAESITATDTMSLRERAGHFFNPLSDQELTRRKNEARRAAEAVCESTYAETRAKITGFDRFVHGLISDKPKPDPKKMRYRDHR